MKILITLIILTAAILLFAYYGYFRCFYSPLKGRGKPYKFPNGEQYVKEWEVMKALVAEMEPIPYEQVWTTSFDGLKLSARYYHVSDEGPLHIQFHGYHGNPVRDFCGGNKIARESGHSTLVIEHRAHGKSEGTTITFGVNERRDCLSWIEYARSRFGEDRPMVLEGVSMGAATVLMAADLDLPDNIIGITADCPYSSPKAIICKVSRDMHLPSRLMWPFVWLGARIYGRFDPNESGAVQAVRSAKVPVLLIHGEADLFVPCDMSREIAANCASELIFQTFPEAGHGLSYIVDETLYKQKVSEALDIMLERYYSRKQQKEGK